MILRDMNEAEALCRKFGFPPYGLAGNADRQPKPPPKPVSKPSHGGGSDEPDELLTAWLRKVDPGF